MFKKTADTGKKGNAAKNKFRLVVMNAEKKSKEDFKASMVAIGIITKDGKLTAKYKR